MTLSSSISSSSIIDDTRHNDEIRKNTHHYHITKCSTVLEPVLRAVYRSIDWLTHSLTHSLLDQPYRRDAASFSETTPGQARPGQSYAVQCLQGLVNKEPYIIITISDQINIRSPVYVYCIRWSDRLLYRILPNSRVQSVLRRPNYHSTTTFEIPQSKPGS